jgi:CHASE3 domain sensor protein
MTENEIRDVADDRTSAFLDVEQVAHTLVARLNSLEQEANHYSTAAAHLDEAAQATRELTAALRKVGDGAAEALSVVASVGGPEIVRRLSSLETNGSKRSAHLLTRVNLAVVMAGTAALLALVAVIVAFVT